MDEQHTARARRLAELLVEQPDEAAHTACLDDLEAYVTLQLAGGDYATRFPHVARHLDQCVGCAESYAMLYEALAFGFVHAEPPVIPAPNLAFLEPNASGPLVPEHLRQRRATTSLHQLIERAVMQARHTLRVRFSEPLLAALRPAGPILALRGTDPNAIFSLSLDAPTNGVERLEISAYATDIPDQCDLRVQVALTGREWPDLEGIPVTISIGEQQRQMLTDAWGEVQLPGVLRADLSQLEIEVSRYETLP